MNMSEIENEENKKLNIDLLSEPEKEAPNQEQIEIFNKRKENNEIKDEITDTNDLIEMSVFNTYELKRNYLSFKNLN